MRADNGTCDICYRLGRTREAEVSVASGLTYLMACGEHVETAEREVERRVKERAR